ncbi:MAG: histidine phosphatase family protein [Verrucomicrobiota bacterium]
MKHLLIIRHGKSSWESGLSDFERPLNDRGEYDAPRMGKALKLAGISPDSILSSSAIRAFTTAKILADTLEFPQDQIETSRDLYLADTGTLLRAIQRIDEEADTTLLFGHNPGHHEISNRLLKVPAIPAFPTLAVAHLSFDVDYWANVEWGTGELVSFLTPKTIDV